jgi:hypothetical protein
MEKGLGDLGTNTAEQVKTPEDSVLSNKNWALKGGKGLNY